MPTFNTPDGLAAAVAEPLDAGELPVDVDGLLEPLPLLFALPLSQAAMPPIASALAIVVATARLIRMHSPCVVAVQITNAEQTPATPQRGEPKDNLRREQICVPTADLSGGFCRTSHYQTRRYDSSVFRRRRALEVGEEHARCRLPHLAQWLVHGG